jgi:hypothetical protein
LDFLERVAADHCIGFVTSYALGFVTSGGNPRPGKHAIVILMPSSRFFIANHIKNACVQHIPGGH